MRLYGPLCGIVGGFGFLAWVATNGAPSPDPPAIVGLVMFATFFGFAVGYGLGTREH